jgi:hypothetical protein
MISNKKHIRPPNGPGSNGLRGGRNVYSPKVAVGPWLETVGGPSGFHRGFTTQDFQTEAQCQQAGYKSTGTGAGNDTYLCVCGYTPEANSVPVGSPTKTMRTNYVQTFGAPLPHDLNDSTPAAADSLSSRTGVRSDWVTTTGFMTAYDGKKMDKEFNVPQCNMKKPDLEEYRKRWTTEESLAAREARYTSETRRAGNQTCLQTNAVTRSQTNKFVVRSVRFLPGTPRPVETFREKLVKQYGILSFVVLRHFCGPQTQISFRNIKTMFESLEFKTPYVEVNQVCVALVLLFVFRAVTYHSLYCCL